MAVSMLECPNCGKNLHFDIRSQAFPCGSCRAVFSFEEMEQRMPPEEQARIYEAVETAPEEEQAQGDFHRIHGDAYESDDLARQSCPSCGAQVITEAGNAAAYCLFCNNHIVVTEKLNREDKAPNRIIPFQIPREEAEQAYIKLCKRKPYLPKEFRAKDHIKNFRSMYVPFHLCSSACSGTISAVCQDVTTWSDSEYIYTRTDTYDSHRGGSLQFQNIPVDLSEIIDDDVMNMVEPFDCGTLTGFSVKYLSGHSVANPDTPEEKTTSRYQERAKSQMIDALCGTLSHSLSSVKSSKAVLGDVQSEYVLMPVWMLVTQYQGKPHFFAMNGQTGKKTALLPTSGAQVFKWLGKIFLAGTALAFLVQEAMLWLG